jgi:hypothetical protein
MRAVCLLRGRRDGTEDDGYVDTTYGLRELEFAGDGLDPCHWPLVVSFVAAEFGLDKWI